MSAVDDNIPNDLSAVQASLRSRLDQFGQRVRKNLLLEAAAWLAGVVVVLALFTFVLDRTLRLSHFTRRGLLLLFLAAIVIQTMRLLVWPWKVQLKPYLLASALERKTGEPIAARVATVLELPAASGRDASPAMIEKAVIRSHGALSRIDFEDHLDPTRRKRAIGAMAATVSVSLLLIVIFPGSARLWAARFFAGSDQPWPQRTFLDVAGLTNGMMVVPRGEAFALRVAARQGTVSPEKIDIRWKQQGASSENTASLTKFGDNDFRFDFPPVQSDATVSITGGDDVVGPIMIHPVDRPRVSGLRLVSKHPTERQPQTHNFSGDDSGDLAFLPLTQLELFFTANIPVREARVKSSTTQPSGSAVRRINDQQFSLAWEHSSAAQIQIELISADAGLESVPTSVAIGLKTDKPPRVSLGYSGVRQRITPQATIPLVAEARDDFAVDRVEMRFKAELIDEETKTSSLKSTTQPIFGPSTQPGDPEAEVRQAYAVKIPMMELKPGHLLTVSAAATDASYPQPQTGLSRQIAFRVVRPEELFKEILMRQQAERAKLRKQTDEARRLRELLNTELSSQDAGILARQHRSIEREVNRIQTAFSESLTEMRLNVLGNNDSHDLMEKSIIQPMGRLDTELMIPQRDTLDTLTPSDPAAMQVAKDRQDQIVTRLEDILRQMSQWDSFVDVLNQLNEIIRLETQVQKDTSQLKKKQTESVFDP